MYVSASVSEEQLKEKIARAHKLEADDIQIKDKRGTICLHLDGSTINSKLPYTVEVRSLESMMKRSKQRITDGSSDSEVLRETFFAPKDKEREGKSEVITSIY
jgi:hypothetical protein